MGRYEVRVFPARKARPYSVWDNHFEYARESFSTSVQADVQAEVWSREARRATAAARREARRAEAEQAAREEAAGVLLRALLPI